MGRYVVKRFLLLIPVIIGISFVIFFAMNMAQGDYVDTLNLEDASPEALEALREKYGLNKSILEQYLDYMWGLIHGDLGTSWSTGQNVLDAFLEKLPNTMYLGIVASIIGTVVSIPLGILAARRRGSLVDNLASVASVFGLAMPNFWFGIMLMLLFSLKLGWVPSGGNDAWICVLLPAITIGTDKMAALTRTTRSTMLDTLNQDYLRTARAKGVPERTVVNKHALKPAMLPILNLAMNQLSGAIGGSPLTETVFSWPGTGKMVVEAVRDRDIPLACGSIILKCILLCVLGVITELLFVAVDPRLRTHYAKAKSKKQKFSWERMCRDLSRSVQSVLDLPKNMQRWWQNVKASREVAAREREAVRKLREEQTRTRGERSKGKRVLVSRQYSKRSRLGEFWYRFRQNKGAVAGMVILIILALICIFADVIFDYETQIAGYNVKERYQWPSAQHWFGTDGYGRDLFARTMYGARYSLAIGLATVVLSVLVGMPLGAITGYFGGRVDLLLSRLLDILGSIPPLLMGIVIVSALGQSTQSLIIAMAASTFIGVARSTRVAVMAVKNNEYVEAAKAIGMPTSSIIFRHVIPNCLSPIIVRITLLVAGAIISASSLSYLGLGVPVPSPEWGALLSAGRDFIRNYSYLTTFPGLAIMVTVLAFNMVGDGLRDALDPKLKK